MLRIVGAETRRLKQDVGSGHQSKASFGDALKVYRRYWVSITHPKSRRYMQVNRGHDRA
jgi:hypothetical protein